MTDDTKDAPGLVERLKGRWQALQDTHGWLRHVLEAYAQLNRTNGNQYAAAITYFSFLALFPLILLAVSVAGYLLIRNPDLQTRLFAHVTDQVPGKFGTTVKKLLQTAIDNRNSVGVVGLLGVLLTGLGWIGNLRQAIDAVWGYEPKKRNFILSRVANLLVLGGLGLGIVVSLGLTAVGTSLTSQILAPPPALDDVPGSTFVLKVLGIAIAVAGDMIIFWWVLVRLPSVEVEARTALRGVLMAGVGFEILKIVGTYTIAHAAQSKTAGPFASVIAVLVWIQLVTRFMLFCCAWMTTAADAKRAVDPLPSGEPDAVTAAEPESVVRPATVGATLVGAGAVAGALATYLGLRPSRRPRPGPD